ncbi:NUDIX hydrolase domain-like protein [Chaetomium tenue]|uniref:NUDIX hydrolase domain-like protein n=1 Tax=Chaetomium tenue TaxID=1854479 RepID=A0ACB7PEE6_9PEZI|nr:NUDIX hydrolase domain-like protein [Chaetomium globosum]
MSTNTTTANAGTTPLTSTHPSLTPYTTATPAQYLSTNPHLTNLVVAALILHKPHNTTTTNNNRVLLIQRAPRDGFGLKWECPGGRVDTTDASLLHALCREVREETGLVVRRVERVVEVGEFDGGGGERWRKVTFLVGVEGLRLEGGLEGDGFPVVRLSEEEHVGAVWAAEGEVRAGRVGEREIQFAYDAQRETTLEVFRQGRERDEMDLE